MGPWPFSIDLSLSLPLSLLCFVWLILFCEKWLRLKTQLLLQYYIIIINANNDCFAVFMQQIPFSVWLVIHLVPVKENPVTVKYRRSLRYHICNQQHFVRPGRNLPGLSKLGILLITIIRQCVGGLSANIVYNRVYYTGSNGVTDSDKVWKCRKARRGVWRLPS